MFVLLGRIIIVRSKHVKYTFHDEEVRAAVAAALDC